MEVSAKYGTRKKQFSLLEVENSFDGNVAVQRGILVV